MHTHPKTLSWGVRLLIAALLVVAAFQMVRGHELHLAEGVVNYKNWVNKDGAGCCNNQDCRPAFDGEVRLSPATAVHIADKWCPVLPKHYLKTGNAPDGSRAHVCIRLNYGYEEDGSYTPDPCARLLCYQPPALY